MSNTQKIFFFTVIMCLVTGLLLTTASLGLKDRQLANIKLDKQKQILKSLALVNPDKDYLDEELLEIYEKNVNNLFLTPSGKLSKVKNNENDVPIFVIYKDRQINKYAIHFDAPGLWSRVKGYLGINGDGNTIIGFTVYSHGETPGLGGEVSKSWFSKQFIDKTLTNSNGKFVAINYSKAKVSAMSEDKAKNYIDVISGSTITSKGLARGLKQDLEKYEVLSSKLRSNR